MNSMPMNLTAPRAILRTGFGAALVVIFVLALIPLPDALNAFSFQDKLEHNAAFLILMLLGWSGWPAKPRQIAIGLFLYGILIELAQHYLTTNRVGDPWDVVADSTGLLLGWLVVRRRSGCAASA